MLYFQIAAAIVSFLLGITQVAKESAPFLSSLKQNVVQSAAQNKAAMIANMNIDWQYRGNDETWSYYSDYSQKYWCRVNAQGIYEYTERPM